MDFLNIVPGLMDPNNQDIEIVERKGIGHPDTLADGIADAVSIAYSLYCLDTFGAVLHHNIDKVYIGRGHFLCGFGSVQMLQPVQVVVNGRMSNQMHGQMIPIQDIQTDAASKYLLQMMPHLNVADQVNITPNASQHTQREHWYTPRDLNDVPDAVAPTANDTSVCMGHYPLSLCEQLADVLEHALWELKDGSLQCRFPFTGQDVKVMVLRQRQAIDVTICIPIISTYVTSEREYEEKVLECENYLTEQARLIVDGTPFTVTVSVNPAPQGIRRYMLGIGSCIECGEEGLVGRGNSIRGIISASRPHSMEAPYGKNPVYHTGRVHGYLTQRLAKALYRKLGLACTVSALTKASQSLVPPYSLIIQTGSPADRKAIETVVKQDFLDVDYLQELLRGPLTTLRW